MRRLPRAVAVALVVAGFAWAGVGCAGFGVSASAQTVSAPAKAPASASAKHKPKPYRSPLDTIMSSHLWTTVPQAQDFVRDTRPAAKDLKYTPLTSQLGKDPDRPKPRDPANVMALQAELEGSIAQNADHAKGLRPAASPRRRKAAEAR